jgi:hypothetical protein
MRIFTSQFEGLQLRAGLLVDAGQLEAFSENRVSGTRYARTFEWLASMEKSQIAYRFGNGIERLRVESNERRSYPALTEV